MALNSLDDSLRAIVLSHGHRDRCAHNALRRSAHYDRHVGTELGNEAPMAPPQTRFAR